MVRIKNRYLLVNMLYPQDIVTGSGEVTADFLRLYQPTSDSFTPQVLLKTIKTSVAELFGDYGGGAIAGSLQVKYLSPATSTFILKVSRAHYRIVWAALTFMNTIPNGKNCVFRVVQVSGTIRKAEQECIRRAREVNTRAKKELGEKADASLEKLMRGGSHGSAVGEEAESYKESADMDCDEDESMSDGND